MDTLIAEAYHLRDAVPADAAAVVDLIAACDLAQRGETERFTEQEIIDDITGIDGQTRAFAVDAPDGSLVAYGTATNHGSGQMLADGYVHPDHRGQGLGTALVRLTERQARACLPEAPEGARVMLPTASISTMWPPKPS